MTIAGRNAHRGKHIEARCELQSCSRIFLARVDQLKIGKGRFCSPKCVRFWCVQQRAAERELILGHPHTQKRCGKCRVIKPVDDFYPSPNQGRHRRHGWCKECCRLYSRGKGNKDVLKYKAIDPLHYRRKKLLAMYGITHEQYVEMSSAQDDVCAICKEPEKRVLYGNIAYLAIDHDHATGVVRGLLCHRCNTALGAIENEEFRTKALAYLAAHK